MDKTKHIKIQVRISEEDKKMIEVLKQKKDFNTSAFFRQALRDRYEEELGTDGIGNFSVR